LNGKPDAVKEGAGTESDDRLVVLDIHGAGFVDFHGNICVDFAFYEDDVGRFHLFRVFF